jgi:polyphosphate kinase 2 (PPK2 family)
LKTDFVNNFTVRYDTTTKLSNWDPDFTNGIYKNYAEDQLKSNLLNQMSNLQYKLFADKNQAILIILQGVDTSGKDSISRHVMNAFNPQSCMVVSLRPLMKRRYPTTTYGGYTK